MKPKVVFNVLAVACLMFGWSLAQANITQEQEKKTDTEKTRAVTGCLEQGGNADEFKLTEEDGSTWEIHSKGVKLSPHVGHTVTVTGNVWHPKAHEAKEKGKEAMDAGAKEHGHLNATNVKMVSESCKK